MIAFFRLQLVLLTALIGASAMLAQEATGPSGSDAAEIEVVADDPTAKIQDAIASYVKAFNSGDVDTLANAWTEEGVYISRISGNRRDGREALRAQFKSLFEDKASVGKLALQSESIELVSPRVAVESGRATVVLEGETTLTAYKTVFVKDGDRWLIDRVTEDEIPESVLRYERLAALDWMIGKWVDASDDYTFEVECSWTSNNTYISRKYSLTSADGVASSGLQLIGWDPKQKQIRSWLFDSEGSFVSGVWTSRDGVWKVSSTATLSDGSSGSYVGVYRPTEDGNYTWQKVNQIVDGQLLPNLDEVTVLRQ